MASITSATSGPSSSGSTWVGGTVPGTTFAGNRTTTGAAVAAGATSIPVTATTPAVTAGKWLRVVQAQTHYYRVVTGLASGASGNIVLDSNTPIIEAIPASATTINVDMVDDKVTIAHPGTNNASTTAYLLNGAHSAGTVAISVDTGTGTVLAGECVQFEHQIGTDEDDQPIYDNTYYLVSVALTAGVVTIAAPGLAYAMADNVRVVNRGHVVELVANHVWGDDTSSTTAANNGVPVLGTLKASRSVSQTLVCRGSVLVSDNGTFDYGATGDAIAASATLISNDSATLAAGKHGLTSTGKQNPTWRIRGVNKTRNTRLSSPVGAGAVSITVDESTNWSVGDRLIVASDTDDPARSQVITVAGGSPPTWAVSAVTNARATGCRIGNLSSNVVMSSLSNTAPGYLSISTGSSVQRRVSDSGDFLARDIGSASGATTHGANPTHYGVTLFVQSEIPEYLQRIAVDTIGTTSSRSLTFNSTAGAPRVFKDCAIHVLNSSAEGGFYGNGGVGVFDGVVVYRSFVAYTGAFGSGCADGEVRGGEAWASQNLVNIAGPRFRLTNGFIGHAVAASANGNISSIAFDGATLSAAKLTAAGTLYTPAEFSYRGCMISPSTFAGSLTTGTKPSQSSVARLAAVNNDPADNRVLSYYQTTVTDLTTRLRSTYSVKIQPKVASTPITYTFTLPAISGVAQVIKGSLRFDATYGTATPPSIALSGQGVTQSFTAPATADAWHDFSFSFTPTSTGDITATVTVQSTSTAGFAWLDGVWHYPMTQSVRHFGYQWLPQAAQVADPLITVSEATALAYPVTVDHGTNTITVTANATTGDVWHACMADLVQTANQGEPQHITGGPAFTTSYDVVVATGATLTGTFTTTGTVSTAGSGLVNGVYTDSTGRHVRITATELLAGSRVQLYNLTDSTELLNTELTGAGLSHALTHSADKTIRLRAAKVGYLPIEATGVLSASGLSFLNSQATDTVYVANAVDGSTCTEFTPDYPNLQVEVDDPDNITSVQRIYAWTRWANWVAADGIRLMHNSVQAQDTRNYRIDTAVVDAHFENLDTVNALMVVGGFIKRSDGTTVIAPGGSIQMDPDGAYVATDIAAQVNELALLHGLIPASPLEVTETTRTAGTVTQTIATAAGTTTVTRT